MFLDASWWSYLCNLLCKHLMLKIMFGLMYARIIKQWKIEQVWPYFSCCTADSQIDAGKHQLHNNGSLFLSTACASYSMDCLSDPVVRNLKRVQRRRYCNAARKSFLAEVRDRDAAQTNEHNGRWPNLTPKDGGRTYRVTHERGRRHFSGRRKFAMVTE